MVLSCHSYLSLDSDISNLRYFRMFWMSPMHPALALSLPLKCLQPYRVQHQKVDALCSIDIRRMSYFHLVNVMFDISQHFYCSYGSAQDMKHCCWIRLLWSCYSTTWLLSPKYSKGWQCYATDWTIFHCKYRTDRATAIQRKQCRVCRKQGVQKATR